MTFERDLANTLAFAFGATSNTSAFSTIRAALATATASFAFASALTLGAAASTFRFALILTADMPALAKFFAFCERCNNALAELLALFLAGLLQ